MASRTLLLRVTAELPPDEWQITDKTAEIGRLPTSTVVLPHRSVSREHAHISRVGDEFMVEDLRSKNGTWLNDQQVKGPMALSNGDTLLIGDVPLQVVLSGVEDSRGTLASAPPVPSTPTAPPPTPILPSMPVPPPLPRGAAGPSTVMVGLDDVLANTPRGQGPRPKAWDETPSSHKSDPIIEPATPTPTLLPTPTPEPPGPRTSRPSASDDDDHPTIFAPLPTDLDLPPVRSTPLEPSPAPQPVEPVELEPFTPRVEPASATLARLSVTADSLAAALRFLSGDLATAVWLFDHAGGEAAAQTFIDCVNAAYLHPDDPLAQQAVLDEAPTAARLLQAATMVLRGLLPLVDVGAADGRGDEAQADPTDLEPVAGQ